ncbi:Uncharacterized protein Fot_19371 [Forsythia ovata]|uniref:Uncharacterized protein n=1 Tax=Forsythia ovata TaxID=205694 RepID=A0ABD1VNN6_9LAMI
MASSVVDRSPHDGKDHLDQLTVNILDKIPQQLQRRTRANGSDYTICFIPIRSSSCLIIELVEISSKEVQGSHELFSVSSSSMSQSSAHSQTLLHALPMRNYVLA